MRLLARTEGIFTETAAGSRFGVLRKARKPDGGTETRSWSLTSPGTV